METTGKDLIVVLTICNQYDSDTTVFSDNGVIFIDGYKAVKNMTKYEQKTLLDLGFKFDLRNGIYYICQQQIIGEGE